MQIELLDRVYDDLTAICMNKIENNTAVNLVDLLMEMMDHKDVPINYPYNHFIVPAAMLTVAAIQKGKDADELESMLVVAKERSKFVPPGACGNLGACGSGVGAGIFVSVFTDSNPLATETWQWTNEASGICLQALAKVPGPRCCKRTTFLSIKAIEEYVKEKLDVDFNLPEEIECKYHEKNPDCKLAECPFYRAKAVYEIIVPDTAMPRLDPVNPCECQKHPVDLTYKKGKLLWLKKVGDTVKKGEMICEAEVEKKTIEFYAPEDGVLAEILVENDGKFKKGDILGYIKS